MKFFRDIKYGRELFYPIGKLSSKFIEAFPGSSGKRKCLTIYQKKILEELGVICKVRKTLEINVKGAEDVSRTNNRLRCVSEAKVQPKDRSKNVNKIKKIYKRKKSTA